VISSTDAAEDLQTAAQLSQSALERELEISVNSRLLENDANDDKRPDKNSEDFIQVQSFQVEEEVPVGDNNGDEEQDRIRAKAQNDSLVVYVGNCVQAHQEVCRFARSITERISTGRPHTSPTPTADTQHSHINATPNEHRYKYWEPAAQSTPTSSPRSDTSPRSEQDVNGSDSKSVDINAESASLDALIRELQLLKQKIERIEKAKTSSGDTSSSNQDLISQLQQLLSNGKQPDSHSEPVGQIQDPLSQIRNLLGVGAQSGSYREPMGQPFPGRGDQELLSQLRKMMSVGASYDGFGQNFGHLPAKTADQDLMAQFRQYLEREKLTNPALRDPPEEKKAPVRFHDAIGRKFNFPFHLCTKWKVRVISMASRHC
jgi:hypothetical protein